MAKLSNQELLLFKKLVEKRKIQVNVMEDPSMSGLVKGSEDIYSDPAHFVYELLQNADDAKATKAYFYLYSDRLIFKHNGSRQFTITEDGDLGSKVKPNPYGDINSITAYSSTKDNETTTIGKFGLGFKSVYTYTDRPQIYDDKFWFAIEKRMIPVLLDEDHELRSAGETLFVLPLKNPETAVKEISFKLVSLKAPTLFLQNLGSVYYSDSISGNSYKYVKHVSKTKQSNDIYYEHVKIEDCDTASQLLLFHRNVDIQYKDEGLKVSVGYFFNDKGEIDSSESRVVNCFFPTEASSGLCFTSHAPFLLSNNRQSINDNDFNKNLIHEICRLAADSLVIIKNYKNEENKKPLIASNLYSIIPYRFNYFSKYNYPFQVEKEFKLQFLEAIKKLLENQALLYTVTRSYSKIGNACFFSNSGLHNILKTGQVRELFNDDKLNILIIEENADLRSFLKGYLSIMEIEPEDLAKNITPSFMQNQGTEWAKRLYKFLKSDAVRLLDKKNKQSALFRYSPILYSQNETWIAPYDIVDYEEQPNIYLPIGNSKGLYNFIHHSMIDKDLEAFYDILGLSKPNIIDFIQKQIVPKYHDELEDEEVLADFKTIIEIYHDDQNKSLRSNILNLVMNSIPFRTLQESYSRPTSLYFFSPGLNCYFGDHSKYRFLDLDFYKSSQIDEELLVRFFKEIRIRKTPRLMKSSRRYSWLSDFNNQRCTQINPDYTRNGYLISDYYLDGFSAFITSNLSKESSIYLWNALSDNDFYMSEQFEYGTCNYFHYKPRTISFESSFIDNLKYTKWLVNEKGEPCSPSEITQDEMKDVGYKPSELLFDIFGIEKRHEQLDETGLSDEQIMNQRIAYAASKRGITSAEELDERLAKLEEYEKAEAMKNQRNANSSSVINDTNKNHFKNDSSTFDSYGSSSRNISSNLDELFNESYLNRHNSNEDSKNNAAREEKNQKHLDDFKRRIEEEGLKKLQREELKQEVEEMPKYSKEWFQNKLKLEYQETGDRDSDKNIKRSISISFSRILVDNNSRIVELKNPSRDIPLWIEEIDNLSVKFLFNDRDEQQFTFEVASVKDFSLRLKAKASDVELFSSINWSMLTQATIDQNNPTSLVHNYVRAFNELSLPDGFNLKENLKDNISFVFGPPGTGKTTYLSKFITQFVNSDRASAKVLVLTPTNKACDVIVRGIMKVAESYVSWLSRFVITDDPVIEEEGLVCDRYSELFKEDRCCIVTTMARLAYDGFQNEDGHYNLRDIDWDIIICDEASMIPVAQITYAIYKFRNVPFVIAGDPKQISPIDVTENWNNESIYNMVQLKSFENPVTEPIQFKIENLNTQYRSVPSIGNLFSDFAYGGKLNHYRKQTEQLLLNIPELPLKSVTYIPFKVEYDSLYGAKRISGSPIHIYSALLAAELSKYIAKMYAERNNDQKRLKIGIICPYASQAQLIEKILEQVEVIPNEVKITIGTIHGFQGDQCDVVIAVFNPPKGLRYGAANTHINKLNIINVAISRACDYLIVMMPDIDCKGYENLTEINRLGAISTRKYRDITTVIPADEVERVVFGKKHYLESNTFVTSHQLANVYTKPTCLYEIRVDDHSVDIQIGE